MKRFIVFLTCCAVAGITNVANANFITCNSEDTLDPINKTGIITFDFEKNEIINTKKGATTSQVIYNNTIICGKDISSMTTQPLCTFLNQSSEEYVKYDIACEQTYSNGTSAWFSTGAIVISSNNSGQFNCRLKYPSYPGYQLRLTNCH